MRVYQEYSLGVSLLRGALPAWIDEEHGFAFECTTLFGCEVCWSHRNSVALADKVREYAYVQFTWEAKQWRSRSCMVGHVECAGQSKLKLMMEDVSG